MQGVNKVTLIGNLGRDPEMRFAPSGASVANFSIAIGRKWKDKNSGEQKEHTEWVNVVAFGRLAEVCGEYLTKGAPVYCEGRMQTDSYEKDGVKTYTTKVVISEMRMLGSRPEGGQQTSKARPAAQQQAPQESAPQQESFDDDIPF